MIEIFDPEEYLFSSIKKDNIKISKCNSCFRKGIVLNPKLLYYLIKGSYVWEDGEFLKKGDFIFTEEEKINYKSLFLLLNKVREAIGEVIIFITPHIFTKFIHELREGVRNPTHFKNIIDSFAKDFNYIEERELKKEEIIAFEFFKNRYCGLSETSLILLKNKIGEICLVDSSEGKILKAGGEGYLFVDFSVLVSVIKKYEERGEIV